MNTTFISASELKRNTAEILNRVYYEKIVAVIKRHNEPIAKIVPMVKGSEETLRSNLDKYFGIWKNEKWAKDIGRSSRHFRKRQTVFL